LGAIPYRISAFWGKLTQITAKINWSPPKLNLSSFLLCQVKKVLTIPSNERIICIIKLIKRNKERSMILVRVLFKEKLHYLKKKAVITQKKSELVRQIVKKCLDK